jgi:hypothetical protein
MREEVLVISIHSFYARLYEKETLSTGAISKEITGACGVERFSSIH